MLVMFCEYALLGELRKMGLHMEGFEHTTAFLLQVTFSSKLAIVYHSC